MSNWSARPTYTISEAEYLKNQNESNELTHYGVKGMKWGVRRTPEQLGHARLKKSKTYNLEKWGSDADHNICYITGISGSGKSTVAKSMANKSTDVIHLDAYYEKNSIEKTNKAFDEYLSKRGIKPPKQYDISKWSQVQALEKFENALDSFGKSQFLKNRKVLAEGIQVYNRTLFDEQQYYRGKPMVFVNTGVLESVYKAVKRTSDYEEVSFLEALGSFENAKTWVNNSFKSKKYLKDFEKRITHSSLTHYGVKGMHWGVRKDLAKAHLSKSFNDARYSKPIQTAVNTKVGKAAKKALYTTFDVKNFDDLAVKVGKMAGSPKGIAALAAIVVLPDPLIWTGMAAYVSIKNSGVLKKTHV